MSEIDTGVLNMALEKINAKRKGNKWDLEPTVLSLERVRVGFKREFVLGFVSGAQRSFTKPLRQNPRRGLVGIVREKSVIMRR